MIDIIPLPATHLQDKSVVEQWVAALQKSLNNYDQNGNDYKVSVQEDTERHLYLPVVSSKSHGITTNTVFNQDFFASGEYRHMMELGTKLSGLLSEGAYVQRADRQQKITLFKQAFYWLMEEAKRGQVISRYKGLGEMNPDQLWETTMNPATRRMLQVKIEDAFAADQIFTTLMGDQVDPRRQFIEENALAVGNLDV
jgi:DNA gyrase subunit B